MDKNDAKPRTSEPRHADLFKRFLREIQLWCRTGKEPKTGSQDLNYYLDLQEKRLLQHNLKMETTYTPRADVHSTQEILSWLSLSHLGRFQQSTYFQSEDKTVSYYRDGKKIYSKDEVLTVYQIILDAAAEDRNIGSTTYVCPNCGAISTLNALQEEGCPYCGTKFIMKDLYPKVTNYYCLDQGSSTDKQLDHHKRNVVLCALPLATVLCLINFPKMEYLNLILAILTFVMAVLLSAFVSHLGLSLLALCKLLVTGLRTTPVMCGSAGSKKKLTKRLSKYDPSFSYEYFESKALSFARMILFHDELANCVQYKGSDHTQKFDDIVDIEYRGGMGVTSIQEKGDYLQVSLRLYLTTTLDNGRKIRTKPETIHITMRHNIHFPVDLTFSIRKVQCPGCNGSFDARTTKCCPYCGREFDAGINDWVITEIRR